MDAKDRIIVALDVSSVKKAIALVEELKDHVGMFKIGLELMNTMLAHVISPQKGETENSIAGIQNLFNLLSGNVFWDGKLHDIPNTVAGASYPISSLGVRMFNVHASGGIEMMRQAAAHRNGSLVLAVTVLTSLSEEEAYLVFGAPSKAKVIDLARMAVLAGIDGIVCSPQELGVLGKLPELKSLIKVIPGVRPTWAVTGDQARVMTPGEAVRAGADYLVIGRPITQPPPEIGGPVEAAQKIAEEIAMALEK